MAAQLCALSNWENFEKGPLRSHLSGKAEAVHSHGFLEVRVGTFSLLENHHRRARETLRPHPGDRRNEVWLGAPRLSATCAHAGRKLVWRAPARGDAATGPGTRRPSSPSLSLLHPQPRRERADTALNPELQEEVQVPARAQTGARSSSPPCAPDFGGAGRFCLSTRRPDPRGPGRECAGSTGPGSWGHFSPSPNKQPAPPPPVYSLL